MPCRINRARIWSTRIQLEAAHHSYSTFVTLTYDDDHLPQGASLRPRDLKLWFLRVRKLGTSFRYFAVGEYGDQSARPHYHAVIFGLNYLHMARHASLWQHGSSQYVDLTVELANYITGYVTKKLSRKDDPRLEGRYPEFGRMSNRPGIGARAADKLADVAASLGGSKYVVKHGDIPVAIRMNGKEVPIGRYLRDKARSAYGMDGTSDKAIRLRAAEHAANIEAKGYDYRSRLRTQTRARLAARRTKPRVI